MVIQSIKIKGIFVYNHIFDWSCYMEGNTLFVASYANDSSTLLKVSYWVWLESVPPKFMCRKPGSQCYSVGW